MKKLLVALLCLGLCGCASFYANRYPNDTYSPTSPEMIQIYNDYPPNPYDVIGEVGGSGAPLSSWQGMGKRLKEYAAQMGGDAVVIAEQATPYVGTYTTPTTISTTSSAYGSANTTMSGSAQVYGNSIYGQASGQTYGQAYGQSNTVITPGTSTPMYGKLLKAYVIKYRDLSPPKIQDETYGNVAKSDYYYVNENSEFHKTARMYRAKVFSGYKRTKDYYDLWNRSQNESDEGVKASLVEKAQALDKEILSDINKAAADYAVKNQLRAIYAVQSEQDERFNASEDVTDKILSVLNSKPLPVQQASEVVKSDEKVNPQSNDDLEDKLKTLNKLLADDLITKDEFEARKQKLLDNLTSK